MGTVSHQTSGLVLRHVVEFVEERFGARAKKRLLASKATRDLHVRFDLLFKSLWYPTQSYKGLLSLVTNRFLRGDPRACEDIGGFVVEKDFAGAFRAFLHKGRPDSVLLVASEIWRQYRTDERLQVIEASENHAVLAFDDPDAPHLHDWYFAIGGWKRALQLAGAENLEVDVKSGLDDETGHLVARFDWS